MAANTNSFKDVLEKLCKKENLSVDECQTIMNLIANGEADQIQTSAFLALLRAKGETSDEICGLVQAMRSHATKVVLTDNMKAMDIVGTGGDGHDTINISTAAAIVLSSIGVKVAKHGNRSVSSKSGSADVLEKLGVPMISPETIADCVDRSGIAFMAAPLFHPAMKYVVPVRKALGIRTVFNIMGPLLNPAGVKHLMLGVYSPSLLQVYAESLFKLGVDHAMVVNSSGLDELAPVGNIQALEITKDGITEMVIDTVAMGIPSCEISDLKGGDATYNAMKLRELFSGNYGSELEHIARTIALNAGAGLYVYGSAASIKEGYEMALAHLQTGKVLSTLDNWAQVATELFNKKQKVDV